MPGAYRGRDGIALDHPAGERFAREIAAAVPKAERRTIEAAAHAYFCERADLFNAMCLDFLARTASPRGTRGG